MIDPTTRAALLARKRTTQCALARELQIPVATISDILAERHAHVSLRNENRVRRKLGLAALRGPVELLPNEKIVRVQPPEKRDKRRCLHVSAALYQRLQAARKKMGQSEEDFMERLLGLWYAADYAPILEAMGFILPRRPEPNEVLAETTRLAYESTAYAEGYNDGYATGLDVSDAVNRTAE